MSDWQENIGNTWLVCQGNCSVDLKTKNTILACRLTMMNVYKKKKPCCSLRKLKNSFWWPARGIEYHCLGSQEHICCLQVVWGEKKTQVQLNSEYFSVLAAFSGSASTAAALDQLDSGSLILSFPCLKRTPTAASQLLHSVKQLSDH